MSRTRTDDHGMRTPEPGENGDEPPVPANDGPPPPPLDIADPMPATTAAEDDR